MPQMALTQFEQLTLTVTGPTSRRQLYHPLLLVGRVQGMDSVWRQHQLALAMASQLAPCRGRLLAATILQIPEIPMINAWPAG
jgi:hypothetical protein